MPGFIELFNLTKAYPNAYGQPHVAVQSFTLNMAKGEVVAVIGHSGCGKSTVLTMVAGLNSITHGNVVIDGREVSGPGPDRGVVFQSPCLLPWMTAFQNVMLGVERVYPHATRAQRKQIAEHYLSIVGLGGAMDKRPGELSGGMQQRVGIARALALKPQMLLLDEPFGKLDSLTRMELQEIMLELLDLNRITTMIITHDVDEALFMADRIVMMTTGPRATVGKVLAVPFERPRERTSVLSHERYYDLRAELIGFLDEQDHRRAARVPKAAPNIPADESLVLATSQPAA